MTHPHAIPRPLVRLNQWVILLSVVLTWITGIVWLLVIPLVANLLGVLFNFNPIIRLGRFFLKKAPSAYIPEDVHQQKFNACIASFCLAGGFISFILDWLLVGYVFTGMVAIASSIAIAGFCIGCFLNFQLKQWKYRRTFKKAL